MEKPQSSILRYRVFGAIVAIVAVALNAVFFKTFSRMTIPVMSLFCYFVPIIFLHDERKKELDGIYFSKNGLGKYKKNELVSQIDWNDMQVVQVKTLFRINKSMYLKISSRENSNVFYYIHIEWFIEKSIIDLTKKYVPKTNDLYCRVHEYAEDRKIMF